MKHSSLLVRRNDTFLTGSNDRQGFGDALTPAFQPFGQPTIGVGLTSSVPTRPDGGDEQDDGDRQHSCQ